MTIQILPTFPVKLVLQNCNLKRPLIISLYEQHIGIIFFEIISILHRCMVWIEKSVMRVTDRHHKARRVMPNSDPE